MKLALSQIDSQLKQVIDQWLVDSGATHHFCGVREWFESYTPLQIPIQTAETTINAAGYGTIQLKLNGRVVTLQDVIYISQTWISTSSQQSASRRITLSGTQITHTACLTSGQISSLKQSQSSQICLQLVVKH
jgi:hypothetical protein